MVFYRFSLSSNYVEWKARSSIIYLIDISHINDLQRLKAMAYDELAKMEQAKRNLDIINARIIILTQVQDHDIKRMLETESIEEKADSPGNQN